jgi:predicted metal-dependent peptidase
MSTQTETVENPLSEMEKELAKKAIARMNWALGFMVYDNTFFAEIMKNLNKIPTTRLPTMGVSPKGIHVELAYNPFFVDTLEDDELRWALMHEILHVALHHITHRQSSDHTQVRSDNIAADLAINSLLPSGNNATYPIHRHDRTDKEGNVLGKKGEPWVLLPSKFKTKDGHTFPERLSFEQYRHLFEEQEGDGGGGQGQGQGQGQGGDGDGEGEGQEGQVPSHGGLGDHSGWDSNGTCDDQIRDWVNRCDQNKMWGSMSAEMVEMIRAAQKHEVPWHKVLRRFYGQISTSQTEPTYKRPSRRMWYPWSGRRRVKKDRKLVGIDDSGSVSDAMLSKFVAETNAMVQSGQPVDMITWDAGLTMKKAIPWDKRKVGHNFVGRGGTDPQPCLDYAKEHGYKELIMLTDGYFSEPTKPPKLKVIWVITPDGTTEALPKGSGNRVIQMKEPPR